MSLRNANKPYGHSRHVHFVDDIKHFPSKSRSSVFSSFKLFRLFKNFRSVILVVAAIVAIVIHQMMPSKCLDPLAIFKDFREIPILNQDQALSELQLAFRSAEHNSAIILVGPPGVGKTLITRHIQTHYRKLKNFQSVNWDMLARYEGDRIDTLNRLLHEFGDCGLNLMIIDNLETYNYEIVENVRNMVGNSKSLGDRHIVFMYVFRVNPKEHHHVYDKQWEMLQYIPKAYTINFREFTEKEVKDCIRHEAKLNNIKLSRKQFEKIVESIDVKRTGCNDVNRLLWEVAEKID